MALTQSMDSTQVGSPILGSGQMSFGISATTSIVAGRLGMGGAEDAGIPRELHLDVQTLYTATALSTGMGAEAVIPGLDRMANLDIFKYMKSETRSTVRALGWMDGLDCG